MLSMALLIGSAACSKPAPVMDGNAADNAVVANEAVANDTATPGNDMGPVTNDAAPIDNAADATPAEPALGDYVGHYPFDKVKGQSFLGDSKVLAAIHKTVTDKEVLDWVTNPDSGPSDVVYMKDGKIAAWSCQQHNCGDHNWTVLVDPAGTTAELCYHDSTKTGADSRWYAPGASAPETRPGDCPSSTPSM
jgi:hypothetical protein